MVSEAGEQIRPFFPHNRKQKQVNQTDEMI